MEKLEEKIRLKTFEPDDNLVKHLKHVAVDFEKSYKEIAKRVNWLLDISGDTKAWRYFKLNGTECRIGIKDADNFEIQKKVGGIWQSGNIVWPLS